MVRKYETPAGGDGGGSRKDDHAGGLIASENSIADSDDQLHEVHYARQQIVRAAAFLNERRHRL
jgi:hypothetical protein